MAGVSLGWWQMYLRQASTVMPKQDLPWAVIQAL
jgi:hypothetical protein